MMDLKEEYRKEKGKWANVVCSDSDGETYYTDQYTEWLEEKVVKAYGISPVRKSFHCQAAYENDRICDEQCDHCKEYYKPLEQ